MISEPTGVIGRIEDATLARARQEFKKIFSENPWKIGKKIKEDDNS